MDFDEIDNLNYNDILELYEMMNPNNNIIAVWWGYCDSTGQIANCYGCTCWGVGNRNRSTQGACNRATIVECDRLNSSSSAIGCDNCP